MHKSVAGGSAIRLPSINSKLRNQGLVNSARDSISSSKVFQNISHIVYSDSEGKIVRDEVMKMCFKLEIDPMHLPARAKEEFEKDGVDSQIQDVRFAHYTTRRMKLLDLLNITLTNTPQSTFDKSGFEPKIKIPDSIK